MSAHATYRVDVTSVPTDGTYAATLTFEGTTVASETGFRTVDKANRWAAGEAAIHKSGGTPPEVESYSRTFHL